MRALLRVIVFVLGAAAGIGPALAEEESPPPDEAAAAARPAGVADDPAQADRAVAAPAKREAVRPWAYKRLERAYAALAAERYDEVIEALDEMRPNSKLNGHERALMWQTYGYAFTNREEYAKAADAFASCLAEQALPAQATLHTRYNLAQLLVMLERPDAAIAEFEKWFREASNPSPIAYYMAAMAYMQGGRNEEALRFGRQALERAAAPKESWLQLMLALHLKQQDLAAAEPVLLRLLELFPKKTYWMQLSAVYSEMGRHEKALTTLELVHAQGLLDQGNEYIALAQMYLYNQIPYQAARVLEEGLAKKALERTPKNLQLLADSWLHARERERAMPPLREAAELAADGNGYLRVAQILVEQEKWEAAREALNLALEKGELRHEGHANLLLGIASANERRWGEAEHAFAAAAADEQTEKAAKYWLEHLENQRAADRERVPNSDHAAAPASGQQPYPG